MNANAATEAPAGAPPTRGPVAGPGQRQDFPELSTKEMKRLLDRSTFILLLVAVSMVAGLIALLCSAVFFFAEESDLLVGAICGAVGVFFVASTIGCFVRTSWGRALGFVVCIPLLPALVGFGCLFALVKGGPLFGPNRLDLKALKVEFRRRTRNRVA